MPSGCPTCGTALRPVPAPGTQSTTGSVAAVLEQRPRWRCAQQHDAGPVFEPTAVFDQVSQAVPEADRRRLSRTDRCAGCSARLGMPTRRTVWPVTLTEPEGLVVVTLVLDVPATRCPDCGLQQVPHRSGEDLRAAVAAVAAPG